MKKILISLIIVLSTFNNLKAQDDLDFCTSHHDKAFGRVVFYLSDSQLESERIKAGTTNISIDQISHVDNPEDCRKITEILKAFPKSKRVLEGAKSTRFYYQTDDFYYVTWTDVNRILGTSSMFIVINKLSEDVYYCYL